MNAKDLGETLKALVANGKQLREAGYTRIEVGDIKLDLAGGMEVSPVVAAPAAAPGVDDNPIDDPDTFGGEVPQRRVFSARPTEHEE